MSDAGGGPWETDELLGSPYQAETIPLGVDEEGVVEATLVRLAAAQPTRRAVLYLHGFCDYFFHTEYARWWADRGYDFYALDLRKYGRSLRPHMTPGYVEDLGTYFTDLDEAWQRITERDGHIEVVLTAHSTGGLTLPLWLAERSPEQARALILNSPWVDMHGPFLSRIASNVLRQVGGWQPRREVPRGSPGFYARSLHTSADGEWDYSLDLKPAESWPVFAGWLRAIRRGHARLHTGLDLPYPTLLLTSGGTARPAEWDAEQVTSHDVVLDVEHMRRWAPRIARQITLMPIEGAMHDVVLSAPAVRARVYDELGRWCDAYLTE